MEFMVPVFRFCSKNPTLRQNPWRDVDRYGRPIVAVDHAGADVGAEQVRRGMAWVYRQYSKDRSLYALDSEARAARRGLWADSQPAPPWEWRKKYIPIEV